MIAKMQSSQGSDKDKKSLKRFLKKFNEVTKDPHEYLSAQPKRADKIKNILKELYHWAVQKDEGNRHPDVLPELILDDMDEEQIWQQIEIYNDCTCPGFLAETAKLLSIRDKKFTVNFETNPDEGNGEDEGEDIGEEFEDDMSDEEDFSEDEDFEEDLVKNDRMKLKKTHRKTVVDDKFFKLGEMEEFLNMEDEKEKQEHNKKVEKIDLNAIDYFNGNLDNEEEENVNYKDFFEQDDEEGGEDGQKDRKNTYDEKEQEQGEEGDLPEAEDEDDFPQEDEEEGNDTFEQGKRPAFVQDSESNDNDSDDNEGEDQVKSSFEVRQQRLKQRIEEYEEEALAEKPWQLKGEIVATGRPQNSLLQEVLEYDASVRPPPVITETTTMRLEDIIRQRIKNKVWDDVEKKVKSITTPQEYRKQLILNQEKSKESLAQVYEKEYQKELEKLDPNREEHQEEPKKHKEIKAMMRSLFIKLDALSNFHYSPKPVAPEPKIITNTPVVNMEEIAPVAMSDAKMLAPEEIKQRAKGAVLGKSERTRTDKNRERRQKKTRQRSIYKAKEERDLEKQKFGIKLSTKEEKGKMLRNVMKNKNVKKLEKTNDGALKSSKAFFTQLQDKTTTKRSKKRPEAGELSAKKFKL